MIGISSVSLTIETCKNGFIVVFSAPYPRIPGISPKMLAAGINAVKDPEMAHIMGENLKLPDTPPDQYKELRGVMVFTSWEEVMEYLSKLNIPWPDGNEDPFEVGYDVG